MKLFEEIHSPCCFVQTRPLSHFYNNIVYSRAGQLYVGTAMQIIENLGNKKFKDHGIFPLVEAPTEFTTTSEGNVWNDFIENIMFRDLDEDGDIDIYLASGSHKTNGMVMLNHGDFSFELVHPRAAMSLNVLAKNADLRKKAEAATKAQQKKIEAAEFKVAIAKRKAKVTAAKAKRIAEEIAKAVDTDPIEDEIAAFEAELEAELSGQ